MFLKRILLVFFICTSFSYAVFNNKVINNIHIKDNKVFHEVSYFKDSKLYNYQAKVILNKNLPKNKTLYLQIFCDVENIIKSNVSYRKEKNSIFVKIDTNRDNELLFSFASEEEKEINFSINNMNEFEFRYLYNYKQLLIGLSLGIVFSAFLYNLSLYFNTRYKAFLYYSAMQFFLFSAILNLQSFIQKTFKFNTYALLVELSGTLFFLFLLLFSKEVLELNKHNPYINKFFNALIIINIVDAIVTVIYNNSYLYDIISRSGAVGIILLTSIYCSLNVKKDAILFAFGWLIILITLVLVEFDLTYISDNLLYAAGLPLEALILSFALGYRLKKIIKEKENLLIQQNKLASMGEMLNNIAHQWKQPLTNLSFINMDLKLALKTDELEKKYLEQIANDSSKQIKYMAKTLDNFKGFYQPNKEREKFLHSKLISKAIDIFKPSLKGTKIKLKFEIFNDSSLYSYKNEYIQVVLNILNNAREVIIERKIDSPYIKIKIDKNILVIEDNAGGIKKEIINKIFDPYFTTKHENSGIGLYMSKVILDSHLKGQIEVTSEGIKTQFKIKL